MSYILDALKKAERERGIAKVPTLETIHSSPEKSRKILWGTVTVILVLLAVSVSLYLILVKDSSQPVAESAGSPQVSDAEKLPDTDSPGTGLQAGRSNVQTRDNRASDTPLGTDTGYESGRNAATASGAKKVAVANPDGGMGEASTAGVEDQTSTAPSTVQSSRKISTDAAAISSPPAASETGLSRASVLKDAIDNMEVSIHMYSQTPSKRLIFINGRKYVEGDFVNGSFLIEAITQEGAILSYEGERAVLNAGM